jgi:ADP-L-glycero-D-manno-heptose 6-epimerase
MMYIITGGAGFIGSNLIKGLNGQGITEILVVDNLTNGQKFRNFSDLTIADYMDRLDFIQQLESKAQFAPIEAVFHCGATSATTEWDGRFLMKNNYEYSKKLFHWCLAQHIPYLYASSGSVYGAGQVFRESQEFEYPTSMYAFSKLQFDRYVRAQGSRAGGFPVPVVGLRYFNVYGPREQHKGDMASMVFQWNRQIKETGHISLYGAHDGYDAGEQRRDFVSVEDCVKVNLWCLEQGVSGIFNVGTGIATSFNTVANIVMAWHKHHGTLGEIGYIPFPQELKAAYQSHTRADLTALRAAGYREAFTPVDQGVIAYLEWLNQSSEASGPVLADRGLSGLSPNPFI